MRIDDVDDLLVQWQMRFLVSPYLLEPLDGFGGSI
jgi:hypothetical protein